MGLTPPPPYPPHKIFPSYLLIYTSLALSGSLSPPSYSQILILQENKIQITTINASQQGFQQHEGGKVFF